MTDAPWTPECTEDALLVAFIGVKRALRVASVGADPGTFPILHHLAASGPTRQGHLAEVLGLDASTVSRHVRVLIDEGHVLASRDPQDGRASVLTISASGLAHLAQRLHSHRETLAAATASFSPSERAELIRLLAKLAEHLNHLEETA
ncbi:MAG: MarR family winged helix-turn-helix transcriptional regulator [Candidatus Nanopelagicales bacterium]